MACLGVVITHITFMIRTKLAKLNIAPIRLHSASSVHIPSSVNNFQNMLPIIVLSPLWSPIIRKYTEPFMHSKDAECILMFLSAMPRGVPVAHIYVLKLPLQHL